MSRHTAIRFAFVAALIPLAAACGTDDPGFLLDDAAGDGEVAYLMGRYQLTVFAGDGDQRVTIRGVAVPAHTSDGRKLLMTRLCSASLPPVDSFSPYLDPATIQGVYVGFPLEQGNGEFRTEPQAIQLGVDLDDPINDTVPVDENDPHVVDTDQDGSTGMTIHTGVLGRNVYAGLNIVLSLSGTVEDPAYVQSEITVTVDRQIYGDNIPFFSAHDKAEEAGALGATRNHATFELAALPYQSTDMDSLLSCQDVPGLE